MPTSLFPSIGNLYLDDMDRNYQNQIGNFYNMAMPSTQTYWWEAALDTRFEAGDSGVYAQVYGNIPAVQRKLYTFNKIRPAVNIFSGIERRDRKSIICVPVENGAQETADQFTKIFMYLDQKEMLYESISTAFQGALVTGLNLIQIWQDYRYDPISGDIKFDVCPFNSYVIDPYFQKKDLSDCAGIWRRQFLTPSVLLNMFPEQKDFIMSLNGWNNAITQGLFPLMPENFGPVYNNRIPYDQYFYPTTRKQMLLIDTENGRTFEWDGEKKGTLDEFLTLYPQVEAYDLEIPTVNVALLINGKAVYYGPQPNRLDSYPFVPILGYFNPQTPEYHLRIQGVVRSMRDPQFIYNRRMVIEADFMESVMNSGYKYKENALVNPRDIFLTGQGRGLALKSDAQMSDVEPIVPPVLPQSNREYTMYMGKEVWSVTGVSEENLGLNTDNISGILAMVRTNAGLTGLQPLLDPLDGAKKIIGKKILEIVQKNYTPGKISRICGEEPTAEFYNRAFGQYDASVQEGFNTATQKQLAFAQLVQLRELGLASITDSMLLSEATIQNKTKIIQQADQAQQQKDQIQQMQFQAQMEETKARTELAHARAIADEGLGLERASRVQENQALAVERRAEAEKDREEALLTKVKAIKELEDMDLNMIERLIRVKNMLQAPLEQREMEDKAEGVQTLQSTLSNL